MGWTPQQLVDYARRSQFANADILGTAKQAGSNKAKSRVTIPNRRGTHYSLPVVLAFFAECGLPEPVPEYQFDRDRKWRSDFSWPVHKVCCEIQGGLFSGGAHVRGASLLREFEKLNKLATLGWRVLFVTPDQLTTLDTVNLIRDALKTQ